MPDRRWLVLGLLVLVRIAMGIQFQSIGAVGPALVSGLGLDYAALGTLAGAYLLPGAAMALPAGWLTARLGDRPTVLGGLALMVAGGVATALAPGFAVALVGRLAAGIGGVLLNIALSRMVMDRFTGPSLGLALGLLLSAWPLGLGIGLAVLPALAEATGWRDALLAAAGLCALALPICAGAISTVHTSAPQTRRVWLYRQEWLPVMLAGAIWGLMNAALNVLLGFATAWLVARGESAAAAGVALSLLGFASMVTLPCGGWLGERSGRPLLTVAASLAAISVLLLALPQTHHSALLLGLLGLAFGLPCALIVGMPARVLVPESRALGMGVFYTVFYVVVSLSQPLAGWAGDATGDAAAPLVMANLFNLLGLAGVAAFALAARRARAAAIARVGA
jgi:predicted MFS family arabinose efflux permease